MLLNLKTMENTQTHKSRERKDEPKEVVFISVTASETNKGKMHTSK